MNKDGQFCDQLTFTKKALYVLYNASSPCRQVVHTQYGCPAKYRGENAGPFNF